MPETTDSVLSYSSELIIGSRHQWIEKITSIGDNEDIEEFHSSSFHHHIPINSPLIKDDLVSIYVNGWMQKPSRYLWDMMRFSDNRGIYLPSDQFKGSGVLEGHGAIIIDRLLTSVRQKEKASVGDIGFAVREEEEDNKQLSHSILISLIFTLLYNGVTKEECLLVRELANEKSICSFRLNCTNYDLYSEIVNRVENYGKRDEAFMWLFLLDDATISYEKNVYFGGSALNALAALLKAGVSPEKYLELRRKNFNTIESIVEVSTNHIDSHLIDSLLMGGGMRYPQNEQEETLSFLEKNGFIQIF